MAQPSPTQPSPPRRRGRQVIMLVAGLVALGLLTRYDLALVLWLAYYPVQPWAMLLEWMLLAGPVTGSPVMLLLLFVLPTLLHLASPRHVRSARGDTPSAGPGGSPVVVTSARQPSFVGGLVARLARWRAPTGYLMAAGWCGGVSIYVVGRLLVRPSPSAVLSGEAAFSPWYQLQVGELSLPLTGSAAGNAGAMALLLAFALLLRRAGRTGPATAMGVLALLLSALAAVASISLQTAWPVDVGLSALLGLALPLWLYGLRMAEAPRAADDEFHDNPAGLPADGAAARRRDPWARHPAAQGHWPIRFSIAYLGLGIAVLLVVGGLHGAPGSNWLHVGVGLLALLFFGWRLRRLLRPLTWGIGEE